MSTALILRSPRSLSAAIVLGGLALAAATFAARATAVPAVQNPTAQAPHQITSVGTITFEGVGEDQSFEIKDFSFGVENPTTIGSATGGAGAGKIKFNEFTIKKTSDSASPVFFKNCVVGAHYTNVIITMRKSGGDPQAAVDAFIQWSFEDVLTTKIDWTGPGDEGPEERVSFVYGKVGMSAAGPDGVLISSGPFDTVER